MVGMWDIIEEFCCLLLDMHIVHWQMTTPDMVFPTGFSMSVTRMREFDLILITQFTNL